jgi:hypothetical protein
MPKYEPLRYVHSHSLATLKMQISSHSECFQSDLDRYIYWEKGVSNGTSACGVILARWRLSPVAQSTMAEC